MRLSRFLGVAAAAAALVTTAGVAGAAPAGVAPMDKQCDDGYGHIAGAQAPFSGAPGQVTGMGIYTYNPGYPVHVRVYKDVPGAPDPIVASADGTSGQRINAVGQLQGPGAYYTWVSSLSNTEVCRSENVPLG
ncbi:hypothetical protein GCM10025787_22220 [Saccharopolyspora rosea]|uniref:Secreted protein n=1 Tax=Saccharopolyspora rosea TaxID=524884 RepID=A0ABW3G0F2_9PSEU